MNMKDQIQKRAEEIGKETAYPTTSEGAAFGTDGMTKLELFAAMAMQGIINGDIRGEMGPPTIAKSAMLCAQSLCIALSAAELEGGQNG